jgi:hypothetical protein
MTQLPPSSQLDFANALLGIWLVGRTACTLQGAVRAIEQAGEGSLAGKITEQMVSTLLSQRYYFEIGRIRGQGDPRALAVYLNSTLLTRGEDDVAADAAAMKPAPTDTMILTVVGSRKHCNSYWVRNVIASEHRMPNLTTPQIRRRLDKLEKHGKVASRRWGPGFHVEWSITDEGRAAIPA